MFRLWFRRMWAKVHNVLDSPLGREATTVAAHAAETRLVLGQDATVTATLLQNLGPVLDALHPTQDAVIRTGALLILKLDGALSVLQLTAAQQLKLDHQPQLARSPREILTALDRQSNSFLPLPNESADHLTATPQDANRTKSAEIDTESHVDNY